MKPSVLLSAPRMAIAALAVAALLLAGCAAKGAGGLAGKGKPFQVRPMPLSESASVSLAYLEYLDHLHRMQRMMAGPLEQGDMDELLSEQKLAAEALDRLIASQPQPGLYLEKAGLYLLNRQQIGTAKAVVKEGLERFPEDRNLRLSLVNLYSAEQRFDAAASVLEEYLVTNPGDTAATVFLARLLVDKNDPAKALKVLERIPEENRDLEVLQLLGRAQAQTGQTREARRTLERALALEPASVETLAEMAYVLELDKDFAGAEKAYERILESGDPSPEVRLRLIHLNLELSRPDKALELAVQGPKNSSFLLEAAKLFLNRKLHVQAGAVLDRMDPASQKRADILFYRAAIAFEGENNAEKALGYMEQVPENSPLAERGAGFRIHLLSLLGRKDEALALAEKAKVRFPQSREILLAESGLHEDAKDFPSALKPLDAALALWPEDIEILYRKGVILDRMGDRSKAMELMESIIAREPDNPDALNYVGYTLAEEGRDLDRALVLVKNALGQKPDSPFIIDSLAWVYFRQGKLAEAWKEIRRAAPANDPTIWEHYGDIALALGKKAEARKAYRKALELNPDNLERIKGKLKDL